LLPGVFVDLLAETAGKFLGFRKRIAGIGMRDVTIGNFFRCGRGRALFLPRA